MESLREDSAADLPPAHERALLMTKDEIIERVLREAGVFPPSVLDRRYGDRTGIDQGGTHREEPRRDGPAFAFRAGPPIRRKD